MLNRDENLRFPGWRILGEIGGSGGRQIYTMIRERNGRQEQALLTHVEIPAPRRDPWDNAGSGRTDGQIGPFPAQLAENAEELRRIRQLHSPNLLNWDETLLIQQDNGFGWDAFLRCQALPTLSSLPQGGLSQEQTLRLGAAVCQALAEANQEGLCHRDVSPDNIYITDQGEYKLGGWGLASLLEKTGGGRTGKLAWMAPEVPSLE